jgi:hypothetical protein
MISTILDTKGFEDTLHVQVTNSYAGCMLCNLGKGHYIGNKKISLIGHRAALDIRHFLRVIGQSKRCCPENYYNKIVDEDDLENQNYDKLVSSMNFDINQIDDNVHNIDLNVIKSHHDLSNVLTCYSGTNEENEEFFKYIRGDYGKNWLWHHGLARFHYELFQNSLWYPHCDYRKQVHYRRITTEEYYNYYRNFIVHNRTVKKKITAYHGVKDVWHLYRLPYAKIETDICWDPFHAIYNVCKYVILNWKDERFSQYAVPYCKYNKLHHYLYNKNNEKINKKVTKKNKSKSNAPWVLSEKYQIWIETLAYNILVSQNMGHNFQFKYVHLFKQTGHLRSTSVIQVITVLMKLILTVISQKKNNPMPKPYKLYYLMLSEDIQLLMSPVFRKKTDVINLQNKILELTCMGEGLFPPSETRIVQHQIYCISHHIENGGSIKNYWAAPGERVLRVIKDSVQHNGGRSFDVTAIRRYSNHENIMLETEYSDPDFAENNSLLKDEDGDVFLNLFVTKIMDSTKLVVEFSYGVESFLQTLVLIVKKNTKNHHDAMNRSSLYRLYQEYRVGNSRHTTFSEMLLKTSMDQDNPLSAVATLFVQYNEDYPIKQHRSALIYGTYFRSVQLKEYAYKHTEFEQDFLRTSWNHTEVYSSWFKYRDYYKNIKNIINSELETSFGYNSWYMFNTNTNTNIDRVDSQHNKISYGTFHYFFQLEEYPDDFLCDRMLASATLRNTILPNNTNTFIDMIETTDVFKYGNYQFEYRDHYFVDLYDVFPSNIFTLAVDNNFNAIKNRNDGRNYDDMKKYTNNNVKELKYLLFIELDAERRNIMRRS